MWLFLLIALPVSYGIFISGRSGRPVRETWLFFLAGLTAGTVYSLIDKMVLPGVSTTAYLFVPQFLFYFLSETLIPAVFVLLLVNLLVKGTLEYRFKSGSSVLFGFFTVFVVYRILYRYSVYGAFLLFVKPLLFASFIFYADAIINRISRVCLNPAYEGSPKKRVIRYVLWSLCFIPVLPVAAVVEVSWLLMYPSWIWIVISLLYILGAVGIYAWQLFFSSASPCGSYFRSLGTAHAPAARKADPDLQSVSEPLQNEPADSVAAPLSEPAPQLSAPADDSVPAADSVSPAEEPPAAAAPRKKRKTAAKESHANEAASAADAVPSADVASVEDGGDASTVPADSVSVSADVKTPAPRKSRKKKDTSADTSPDVK